MVGIATFGFCGAQFVCCLLDVGRVSGSELLLGPVSVALLFPGIIWGFAAPAFWAAAWVVARLVDLVARLVDSLGAWGISIDLLLLSWRLLQSLLG